MNRELPTVGINAVRAALQFDPAGVRALWLDRDRHDRRLAELAELARAAGIAVQICARAELDRAANGARHQGALAWTRVPAGVTEADLDALLERAAAPPLLLVLDGVTDPHNLGACLRAADGAGALAVVAPRDKAVGLTPAAVKVASGAALSVPLIQVANLARALERLRERGLWVVGAAADAPGELFDADLTVPLALAFGSEGSGLRALTRARCDLLVRLPMRGQVESLNVAVAAGIGLYEALRQRRLVPRAPQQA